MRQRAIREANASIELLTAQLQTASQVELQQAISRGLETSIKQRALASVRTDYAFRPVDPAKPTDPDDYIRPKKTIYLIFGPLMGLMLGVTSVLLMNKAPFRTR